MEPKKVTREEIKEWNWSRMQSSGALSSVENIGILWDFAKDHGILKEPVTKWKWAWECCCNVPYHHPSSGVTIHLTESDIEVLSEKHIEFKYWKLPGTEVSE